MDYRGQKLCEYIYTILVILFGGVAWIIGYIKNDFVITFYGWAAGLALGLVVRASILLLSLSPCLTSLSFALQLCIPDWPMYNRNKVIWLNEIGKPNAATKSKAGKSATSSSTSAATSATKKKKSS